MNTKKEIITIAVDGESASGKGTVSKLLAKELNYSYLDTGLLYRAVAYIAKEENVLEDTKSVVKIAQELKIEELDTTKLKSDEVARIASNFVANKEEVREALLQYQRDFAKNPKESNRGMQEGVILDGRDIGTVILPQADIKFFVVASLDVRAKRRYDELKISNPSIKEEEIKNSLAIRDKSDKERATGALKKAEDAIEIDTTNYNVEEVFNIMLKYIEDLKSKRLKK